MSLGHGELAHQVFGAARRVGPLVDPGAEAFDRRLLPALAQVALGVVDAGHHGDDAQRGAVEAHALLAFDGLARCPLGAAQALVVGRAKDDKHLGEHAPRQTGKTTAIRELAQQLTDEGRYAALMVSVEVGAAYRDDPDGMQRAVLRWVVDAARDLPRDLQPPAWSDQTTLGEGLASWAETCPPPRGPRAPCPALPGRAHPWGLCDPERAEGRSMMSIDGFGAGLHQRLEPFGDHTAKGAEAMPGTQGG